jgi:hypothetical protein
MRIGFDKSTAINIELDKNPKCAECTTSIDVDQHFKKIFGILVCHRCKNEKPEKYSLLTKTECKEVCSLPASVFYRVNDVLI